ncbi:MAG TPA: hypothetical protein PLX89_00555 [Verrucomicrobiota bacterium]|nr:hypothetical protein [Verrucomicrobiales bacterium]HRI11467.1 hypothetical protein [Verrucomicrobiota bacterium]
MNTSKPLRQILSATAALSIGSCFSTSAATITDFVESPDSLSFKFSGNGSFDFVKDSLPPLKYWEIGTEIHVAFGSDYGAAFALLHHLPDGPTGFVGTADAIVPFGTGYSDTQWFTHGSGTDTYRLSITAESSGNPRNPWAAFSGWFSAVHTTSVPDAGGAGMLLGLGFLALVGVRRLV